MKRLIVLVMALIAAACYDPKPTKKIDTKKVTTKQSPTKQGPTKQGPTKFTF